MTPQKPLLKDKQIVADFLNVSLRTMNRYVKKYNLSVYTHNKEKKIDLTEILKEINTHDLGQVETSLDSFGQFERNYVKQNAKNVFNKKEKATSDNLGQVGTNSEKESLEKQKREISRLGVKNADVKLLSRLQSTQQKTQNEAEIYKKLYEETLVDLKLKQERLEGATYRVGQLEAQIKNSVPLLTYRQKEEEVLELSEIQKKETEKQNVQIQDLQKEKREMQMMKNFYLLTLFSFLVLVPLLLIYFLTQV